MGIEMSLSSNCSRTRTIINSTNNNNNNNNSLLRSCPTVYNQEYSKVYEMEGAQAAWK